MTRSSLILALCLIAFVSSEGVSHVPKGQLLKWNFPDSSTIRFDYYVPMAMIMEYKWVGLGFQDVEGGGSMRNGDFVTIFLEDDHMDDGFTPKNGKPSIDSEMPGGSDDLQYKVSTVEDGFKVYSWSRALDTGDKHDTVFVKGGEVYLLWGCGQLTSYGAQKKHKSADRGAYLITISEYFNDEAMISMI